MQKNTFTTLILSAILGLSFCLGCGGTEADWENEAVTMSAAKPVPDVCGDNVCTEGYDACPTECDVDCGNGTCGWTSYGTNESCTTCPADCGVCERSKGNDEPKCKGGPKNDC